MTDESYFILYRCGAIVEAARCTTLPSAFQYDASIYRLIPQTGGEFSHLMRDQHVLVGFHLFQVDIVYMPLLRSRIILMAENVVSTEGEVYVFLGSNSLEEVDNDCASLLAVSLYFDGGDDYLLAVPAIENAGERFWQSLGFEIQHKDAPVPVLPP